MQINKLFIVPAVLVLMLINACSSDDDTLNSEADILYATIENEAEILETAPSVTSDKVTFQLKETPENYLFKPEFELSSGATIDPNSGEEVDFTNPQEYVVTSEDGMYSKNYTVSFIVEEEIRTYSFENVSTDNTGNYHEFYEVNSSEQKVYSWDTGNEGYEIIVTATGVDKIPQAYPTYQIEEGYEGKGVRMETKSTGELGATFGAPLASGNLFIGEFSSITQPDPRQGVHFGRSYNSNTAPALLKGYFKYERGEEFEVNSDEGTNLTEDEWNAYGILFEKTEEDNYLRADFTWDDPRIVSVALLDDEQRVETDEWTEFTIPFEFVEGKSFNPDHEYMYTIVFAASKEGDLFNGAIGSTLQIDEVQLIME